MNDRTAFGESRQPGGLGLTSLSRRRASSSWHAISDGGRCATGADGCSVASVAVTLSFFLFAAKVGVSFFVFLAPA